MDAYVTIFLTSSSYESTLFHGIEGGIHASAYSSHEIDEHENERASHLAIILEHVSVT
jgi:blocked-early-in-transport protein 1